MLIASRLTSAMLDIDIDIGVENFMIKWLSALLLPLYGAAGFCVLTISCIAGASSCSEARSSASTQSSQDQDNQEAIGSSGTKTSETCRGHRLEVETLCTTVENRGQERGRAIEDMPCVFTKGDGPNGKRIEGILYKYGKGEEVRIMCVCHGNFLSPAEFVKHAGGGDVDHPLRHIVLNPSSASVL